MRFLILFIVLSTTLSTYGQDTIYDTRWGDVALSKTLRLKVFDVIGERGSNTWINGKVKRVDFTYMYKRTYHGCTRPINPDFYKPIKRKSHYLVPVDDITIYYRNSKELFQTFSKDSLILRTYEKDGTRRNVYFLNEQLQVDSLYNYYENGKLKNRIIGTWNQLEDNLVLDLFNRPELRLRQRMVEWEPKGNLPHRALGMVYRGNNRPIYPKTQYHCHGNGNPQVRIDYFQNDSLTYSYDREYSFFNRNGEPYDSAYMTKDSKWTGVQYLYYKTGKLESRNELYRDGKNGKCEFWDKDGNLKYIGYYRKQHCDSLVHYKQLEDTLLSWTQPMHFEWYNDNSIKAVKHKECMLEFNPDGSLRQYKFGGFSRYTHTEPKDEKMKLTHYGEMDHLGLPHGRWLGINKFQDTIYNVNFKHGWLHGKYSVNVSYWPSNWTRTYNMGQEVDSSYRMREGVRNRAIYYSSPNYICKQIEYNADGKIHRIDTTLNGRTFIRLRNVSYDGWNTEVGEVDTVNKLVYTQRFFAPDSLVLETWTDYFGNKKEWKQYDKKSGKLRLHWIHEGTASVEMDGTKEKYNEQGDLVESVPRRRTVQLARRLTYDENGELMKTESLKDGVVLK